MRTLAKLIKFIFYTICLLGLLFAYAIFVEPRLLTTENVTLSTTDNYSGMGEHITIAHFSDTHLGFHFDAQQLQEVVKKINAAQPDIIVFTGDLIDHAKSYNQIDAIGPILAQLEAPLGKYAVFGNHDYGGGAKQHYQDIMKIGGFTLLVNDVVKLTLSDGKLLCIGGLDEVMLGKPDPLAIESQFSPVGLNLLLLHEPDMIQSFSTMPHIALAGHSHGGQVQIPIFGPLISTAYAEEYIEGLYVIDGTNTQLYVNTGIGTTKLPMRFANPPVITFHRIDY